MSKQNINISDLVRNFNAHFKAYKSKETNEAEIRQKFIDPFWSALGWDVRDRKGVGPAEAEVILEKSTETAESSGLRNRRPDYLFRLGGFARFIVEAKKPSVDIDTDKDAIFQAKQYAWNSTIPFAVLTDFEQFRLFDTTLKPIHNDPARGLVKEFRLDYDQYEPQWDVLADTFGRAAVEDGSLERLLAKIKKVRPGRRIRTVDRLLIDLKGGEPVDIAFLGLLDTHRKHLAAAIYRDNKPTFPEANTLHGAARLTEAVQRILDRLVFMRVCEDRDIVPFGQLRGTLERIGTEGGEFYEALRGEFRDWNSKYNGYLFKPWPLEDIKVDGAVLADFVRDLYPPDGPWDFAAIGDDILGTVYERFLGNTIVVKSGHATVEEKMEVRHAGGVYYTPRFVVDSIIRRVVAPKIKGKSPADILDIKILDPACGSGSFLVAALQFLFDHCINAVTADTSLAKLHVPALTPSGKRKGRKKKSEIAFQDKVGQWFLAPDFRAALLTHCLHGVDIDQQAVEVTVMSLYLKMLESKLPINWQHDWIENRLLPTLDNNIQCGNSLIDEAGYDAFASHHRQQLFGEGKDLSFRINRFDWASRTQGFGRLLDSQAVKERGRTGFDCIIGNPPYIRVQELNKWAPEECAYYKWKYQSAAKGNYDIYVVFTERALQLLAPTGLLGFIMPHKYWQAKYGEGLRQIITTGRNLRSVIDFAHHQIFQQATTYTAIQVFQKDSQKAEIEYARFDELFDGVSQCTALDNSLIRAVTGVTRRKVPQLPPSKKELVFAPKRYRALNQNSIPLMDIADLAQGFKTGADKVFVVTLDHIKNETATIISQETGRSHKVEAGALRPLVKSEHMKAYDLLETKLRLIFPYKVDSGRWGLIEPEEMARRFPLLWNEYFAATRSALDKRENARFAGPRFYQYSRPQNFLALSRKKIISPDICQHPQMCYDSTGEHVFSGGAAGGVAIVPKEGLSTFFLLGLLNSNFADDWIRTHGTPFRGGYLNCEIRFIRKLPIKLPKTEDEKKIAKQITGSVRAIIDAKTARRSPKISDRELRQLDSTIESNERRINEAVFQLYGVDCLSDD